MFREHAVASSACYLWSIGQRVNEPSNAAIAIARAEGGVLNS